MGEERKFFGVGVVAGRSEEEAMGDIVQLVENLGPGVGADVYDIRTREKVAQIEPALQTSRATGTSTGYTRSYSDAWDRMMQRRAQREASGQRPTDA